MKNKKVLIIIFLIGVLTLLLSLFYNNSFNNKIKKTEGMLSIYLQDTDGEYYKQNSSEFPKKGYSFDKDSSYCENESALDWVNNKLRITGNMSDKCYVYFNLKKSDVNTFEENNSNTLTKDLVGDMYRFYSSEANNYICFGTEEKCTSDSDYMYRIIGISGNDELKLMKNTSVGNYKYNNDTSMEVCGENAENCSWGKNTLSIGLNGDYFLTNSKYEYLQNEKWLNLIENKNWNIGISGAVNSGSDFLNKEKSNVSKESLKIGIPYLSDVFMGYDGTDTKMCDGYNCLSWWPNSNFLLMNIAYYGKMAWFLGEDWTGWVGWSWGNNANDAMNYFPLIWEAPVFPTFYTKSDIIIALGTGTEDDPYIIDLEKSNQYLNQ